MSAYYYQLCCRHHGKVATITDRYGRRYVGRISRVDRQFVYLQPSGRGLGGFGYGWGWGWGPGFGYRVALGAIAGIAIAGLVFW